MVERFPRLDLRGLALERHSRRTPGRSHMGLAALTELRQASARLEQLSTTWCWTVGAQVCVEILGHSLEGPSPRLGRHGEHGGPRLARGRSAASREGEAGLKTS